MKILSIIETLGRGGAEQILINTLPELQKLGLECEVVMLFDKDDLAEEMEEYGVKVHRLHLSYKWNIIEGVFKFKQLIKKNNYDIIHAHLFFAYFYTGIIKIFYPAINTVTTFHNLGFNTYPANTVWKKLRKKIASFVLNKLIDRKVAVSSAVKEHYAHHLDVEHVDLICNSFPLSSIKSASDVSQTEILKYYLEDINAFQYFSITPGRFVKEKGHQYLIEAIWEVNKDVKGLCHFIVGAGPLEEQIRISIREKQLTNVIVIPELEQQELFKLIKACDFVVVPSISEGFGMVVGEAMALQIPVIATEIDGILDLVENQKEALLVPPKDSMTLAKAMEKLCTDKVLRTRLTENAKEKIKQFDTPIIAKKWKDYYKGMFD